jgi:hypothetical protein
MIISVAGIPLIGVNLRAAIASIETMMKYGFMDVWDKETREYVQKRIKDKTLALSKGEEIILDMYGSHWYADSIYRSWRPGRIYLTNQRLILYRETPAEVLFQTRFEDIKALDIREETYFTGTLRTLLFLSLKTGEVASLYAEDAFLLKDAILEKIRNKGLVLEEDFVPHLLSEKASRYLTSREILADGKMWYLSPATGILAETWRPGWLYLTKEVTKESNKPVCRLAWWSQSDGKIMLEIPLNQVKEAAVTKKDLGGFLKTKEVLEIIFLKDNPLTPSPLIKGGRGVVGKGDEKGHQSTAMFSGELLSEWRDAIISRL